MHYSHFQMPRAAGESSHGTAYADRVVAFCTPLAGIELAGCSFGSVLWARVECDCRARCCLMDGVDHHLEQGQAFWRNPEAAADHHAVIGAPPSVRLPALRARLSRLVSG